MKARVEDFDMVALAQKNMIKATAKLEKKKQALAEKGMRALSPEALCEQ